MPKESKKQKPKEPVWELDRDGLTQSGLNTWLECPEQFSLSYIEGLTPTKLSVPLEFGSIWHKCTEYQFTTTDPHALAIKVGDEYRRHRFKDLPNPNDKETLERLIATIQVLFPFYCQYWNKEDIKLNWVAREEKFNFKYEIDPGNFVVLKGMRDGVFRDPKNRLCLFETKTKSEINEDLIADIVRCDMQLMVYFISLRELYGEIPSMALYNVIRRPGLKWRKDDTMQDYTARLKSDVEKRPDHYFVRWNIEVLPHEIELFERQTLRPALRNFQRWWIDVKKNPFKRDLYPYHNMNSNALVTKYGKCAMYDYIVKGQTTGYRYRNCPFPELV